MSAVLSNNNDGRVIEEWTALVHRERLMAYHMWPMKAKRALSSRTVAVDMMEDEDDASYLPCPSAWREKIVEWCFQVIDHW